MPKFLNNLVVRNTLIGFAGAVLDLQQVGQSIRPSAARETRPCFMSMTDLFQFDCICATQGEQPHERLGMLTVEDCIGLVDLPEEVIEAIAEHEHLPEVVAAELAEYLIESADGAPRIRAMIQDDIEHALDLKNYAHAAKLVSVLRRFIEQHREAV